VEHVPKEKCHLIFSVSRPSLTILTAKFLIFYSDPEEEGGLFSNKFKDGPPRCGSKVTRAYDFRTLFYNFPFVICINFLKRLLKLYEFEDIPHLK